MAEKRVKIWYDPEGDYLEVIFEQKAGYFRETSNDHVMEKVDEAGNVLGALRSCRKMESLDRTGICRVSELTILPATGTSGHAGESSEAVCIETPPEQSLACFSARGIQNSALFGAAFSRPTRGPRPQRLQHHNGASLKFLL